MKGPHCWVKSISWPLEKQLCFDINTRYMCCNKKQRHLVKKLSCNIYAPLISYTAPNVPNNLDMKMDEDRWAVRVSTLPGLLKRHLPSSVFYQVRPTTPRGGTTVSSKSTLLQPPPLHTRKKKKKKREIEKSTWKRKKKVKLEQEAKVHPCWLRLHTLPPPVPLFNWRKRERQGCHRESLLGFS